MNLQGERIIPASVQQTWIALNDPETLKACIAGCESMEATGENQFLARMAVRIGPVNAKFKGNLELSDVVPMQSYRINFDGQGGVAGFGKGAADVTLAAEGKDATKLNYVANAQVGGKIAQIGSRLVESAAAKIANDFFKAFEARMTTQAADAGGGPGASASDASGAGTAAAGTGSGGSIGTGAGMGAAAGGPDAGSGPGAGGGAGGGPSAVSGAGGNAAAMAAVGGPAPVTTIDQITGSGDTRSRANTSTSGTVWWIAGIIVLALLAYFLTR